MQSLIDTFNFVLQNIHVPGWIALICLAFKVSGKVTKVLSEHSEAIKDVRDTKAAVDLLATNHLAHLQNSVDGMRQEVVSELKGVRSDLLTYALNRKD